MSTTVRLLLIPLMLLGVVASARADGFKLGDRGDVGWARSFITAHVAAINAGDLAKVKSLLSARQRSKITAEMIGKAKHQLGKMTVEELVDSVDAQPDDKKPTTVKIKMKGGRTLTTLIKVKGMWYADTIWFK